MALILMIAAGILLAFILLPLLGPLVIIALSIGVIAFLIYSVCATIGLGIGIIETVKDIKAQPRPARPPSYRQQVRASAEFQEGVAAIQELANLQNLRRSPSGLWQLYILNDRLRNCSMRGWFRVEDTVNRTHLERCLQKIAHKATADTAARVQALCDQILACHDRLCQQYAPT